MARRRSFLSSSREPGRLSYRDVRLAICSQILTRAQKHEAMWPRRTRADVAVEVEVKTRVKRDAIGGDVEHMNLVIPFRLAHAPRHQIFDEKII